MADKIIGLRPDGTLNPETIAAVKEVAGNGGGGGTGSVVVTDDGAGTYTVGGTTIKGLTPQGQLPAVAKKYVDDGLAGKANTTHTHTWAEVTGKPTTFAPSKHTHTTADVTGLDTALAGKAASTHRHTWDQIDGKPATVSGGSSAKPVLASLLALPRYKDQVTDEPPAAFTVGTTDTMGTEEPRFRICPPTSRWDARYPPRGAWMMAWPQWSSNSLVPSCRSSSRRSTGARGPPKYGLMVNP